MIRMMIADDEPVMRQGLLSLGWEEAGCEVVGVAENGLEAFEMICAKEPDMILTDIRMPGMDGITLMERMVERGLNGKVIFITAYHQLDYALKAIKLGAVDFVLKPTDPDEIMAACMKAKETILQERKRSDAEVAYRQQIKEYNLTLQGRVVQEPDRMNHPAISPILAYLEAHLAEELSILQVAQEFHFHPDYLSRLFKKETGETYSDTLTRLRLQKAIQYVGDPRIKLYEIAGRVGIRDARYFSQLFKKHYGKTLHDFRKELFHEGAAGSEICE